MNCRSIRLGLVNSKVEFQFTVLVKNVQDFGLAGGGGDFEGAGSHYNSSSIKP